MSIYEESYSDRLHHVIPGGAHTYSRGDDQFPTNAPKILTRGKGSKVYDPDGKEYLDYGMSLRAVTLGYAEDEINQAVFREIENGNNLTRASVTELEAAELLCDLIPCADMVKFAKNGSNVTTAAIKIARSYTGRKYVAYCSDHPFFSFDDWFIGATQLPLGVPSEHISLTLKFRYNDAASLQALFDQYPGQIAAVILEPSTTTGPCTGEGCASRMLSSETCAACPNNSTNFLHAVRQLCTKDGSVLIFDEIITGFRYHINGAQTYFGVTPDLATFGKAMANGFSVAALAGKREIMEQGSIRTTGAERTFLLSSTYGAEMSGLGAFKATMDFYKKHNVVEHLWQYGAQFITRANALSAKLGLEKNFYLNGYACSPNYMVLGADGLPNFALRTLYSQEMIKNGVLMPWISLGYRHSAEDLDVTIHAMEKALTVVAAAMHEGLEKYLEGPAIKPVFRQYN